MLRWFWRGEGLSVVVLLTAHKIQLQNAHAWQTGFNMARKVRDGLSEILGSSGCAKTHARGGYICCMLKCREHVLMVST